MSNCGNPIDFDQISIAFQKHMSGALTQDRLQQLMRLFGSTDLKILTKDEIRVFILRAMQEGIFADFFQYQEEKEKAAIDALFNEIFIEEFQACDEDFIKKSNYIRVVQ